MKQASRYQVIESLGQGGMGEVFLAEDRQLSRKVAIKFLNELLESDLTARERLHREARSAAALDHPYICKIHEIAEVDGRTGIVMEHILGETLQTRMQEGALSFQETLRIAGEVAEALEEAHKRHVVHRDLKPANIMLTEHGHVKVMDFGLAKQTSPAESSNQETVAPLTESGVRIGTPGYMSPEQLLGGRVDERSDIFTFGIVLYEMLAGVHPFTRSSSSGTMSAILKETPAAVIQYAKSAPAAAGSAIDRLLAKEPEDRYQSFKNVRDDLRQILQGQAVVSADTEQSAAIESEGGRTPYVGREAERAEASRLLERAMDGHGGVILLGGEPGVGKTRLAEEILAMARQRGCLALTGRCYEMEGTPPFIPWVEIIERAARVVPKTAFRELLGDAAAEVAKLVPELRQLFSDIPEPVELPPEQQQRYLFSNCLAFFTRSARVTPHVLLIDDLHWSDESTLLLLQQVAQQVSQMPVLVVGTYRDVDLEVDRPFAKTLESLTRQRLAHKVAMKRLPESDVAEMLKALSGQQAPPELAQAVYRETEGNPFFVEEVFHHLEEEGKLFDGSGNWRSDLRVEDLDVPEGIRLVIGRRIQRLSDSHRHLLTMAAIVGRSFDLRLMDAFGADDQDDDAVITALEAAEAAKLIVTVSSGRIVRWEFAHGLIRQTLQNGLSLPRRQRAHLRVADVLEKIYAKDLDRHASDIAHHLYQAGAAADPDKTLHYLMTAGNRALDAGAFGEAIRQFDQALSVLEDDESKDAADLRYRKGCAFRSLGQADDALEEWRSALAVYESFGDGEGIARTAYDAAFALGWQGKIGEGATLARQALNSLGEQQESAQGHLLTTLAMWSSVQGQAFSDAHATLKKAESIAEQLNEARLTNLISRVKTMMHYVYMQLPECVDLGPRAAAQCRERGELYDACDAMWPTMFGFMLHGNFSKGSSIAEDLSSLAVRVGHTQSQWAVQLQHTYRQLLTNKSMKASRTTAEKAAEHSEQVQFPWRVWDYLLLATTTFYAGDWEEAQTTFEKCIALDPGNSWMHNLMPASALYVRAYTGDSSMVASLKQTCVRLQAIPEDVSIGTWDEIPNVVEGLALFKEDESVASCYPLIVRGLEKGAIINFIARPWQMVAGISAASGGQWELAEQHFETALRQVSELQISFAEPEVRRWYGAMLLRRRKPGDREKAIEMFSEAVDMYNRCEMPRHCEMTRELAEVS